MHREPDNLDELIDGCKRDDRKAQEQLYRNYYRAMMTLCLRYTKNEEDALEVLNTGFLKIFRNIHRYNAAQASLYTWMRTIVINSCIDFIKARQTYANATGELSRAASVEVPPEVISKMRSMELLELVRQLPPATQAVFNLYIMEGFNHKEIAAMLGISDGTSKWHLSEARRLLQKKINEQKH